VKQTREAIGSVIDHLVGTSQAARHHAAAQKDLAMAKRAKQAPMNTGMNA